jgi:hypothetical protein
MADPVFDRTVRVPLEYVPDEQWRDLRRLAYQCAAYGNLLLTESYAKTRGLQVQSSKVYTDFNSVLSSCIRDAISREVVGIWRRIGRKILRGEQTLARFSSSRALVVRDRGVRLREEAGVYFIDLRLAPREQGPVTALPVWMPALKRDVYLAGCLDNLCRGDTKLTKATVQFERPGRKIYVRLSYRKPAGGGRTSPTSARGGFHPPHTASAPDPLPAALEYKDGELWLRAGGRALSLNDAVYRLQHMKAHFAGIRHRLSRCLNKRGRRQTYRKALLKAGTFERWAEGPLHQLSHTIIRWCQEQGATALQWKVKAEGDLPWDRLQNLIAYKAQEASLGFSQPSPDPATEAEVAPESPAPVAQVSETVARPKRLQRRKRKGEE